LVAAYASCVTNTHAAVITNMKAATIATAIVTLFMVLIQTGYPLYGILRFFTNYRVIMIIAGEFILSKYYIT
jgi:hypothetical protein